MIPVISLTVFSNTDLSSGAGTVVWTFMDTGMIAMCMDSVLVTLVLQLLGLLGCYGCRFSCGEEDVGFGGPMWSGYTRTS